jgi:SAM-dependent methyltransferase
MGEPTASRERAWVLHPDFPADLYREAAPYYAQYRVPYPGELLDDVRARAQITGAGRLLDLACGTGEVALALATDFRQVWAVDQEPEMVALGRAKAQRSGATNLLWRVGRAEEVAAPPHSFELITIGAAFHRLDRPLIARRALEWLPPGRCLALLGSNSVWTGQEVWQALAAAVMEKWIGDARRGGHGEPDQPRQTHAEVLQAAGFEDLAEYHFPTAHVWTVDTLLGYLHSTAVASPSVLGARREPFAADVRRALLTYDARGQYHETMDFYYILARRPPVERRGA